MDGHAAEAGNRDVAVERHRSCERRVVRQHEVEATGRAVGEAGNVGAILIDVVLLLHLPHRIEHIARTNFVPPHAAHIAHRHQHDRTVLIGGVPDSVLGVRQRLCVGGSALPTPPCISTSSGQATVGSYPLGTRTKWFRTTPSIPATSMLLHPASAGA